MLHVMSYLMKLCLGGQQIFLEFLNLEDEAKIHLEEQPNPGELKKLENDPNPQEARVNSK